MTRGPLPKHPEAAFATLPAEGCKRTPPAWPLGEPTPDEAKLWRDLWRRPIAAMWWAQRVPPVIIRRYVQALVRDANDPKAKLGSTLARLEGELGLTPGALARLHLKVEPPRAETNGSGDADALDEFARESGFVG